MRQVPKDPRPLTTVPAGTVTSSRITTPFEVLSASPGYVNYLLLTLTPVYSPCGFLPRLACLSPAASVRTEPGSNSSSFIDKGELASSYSIRISNTLTSQTGQWKRGYLKFHLTPERAKQSRLLQLCGCQDERLSPLVSQVDRDAYLSTPASLGRRNVKGAPNCQGADFDRRENGAIPW